MEIEHGISHEKMSKKLFLMDISFIMEKKKFLYPISGEALLFP